MTSFEDPFQFRTVKNENGIEIVYTNLMELVQGGPEVGNLSINGNKMDARFGGPSICHLDFVYVPIYINGFLRKGFKIAKINTQTLEVKTFGKVRGLISLEKIENDQIYFYDNISKDNLLTEVNQ